MRLVTFQSNSTNEPKAGIVLGDRVAALTAFGPFPETLLELIRQGPAQCQRLRQAAAVAPAGSPHLEDVTLLAPIPRPTKNIICLGLNYSAHADESARATGADVELPEYPIVFTKAPTSVNDPYADIIFDPQLTEKLDWEVELGVIVGITGKGVSPERALEHVFGYTVINDVSARDLQRRHSQFFLGKSLDGACPMGPWIVTADEIADPQNLELRTYVNDVMKQNGSTADQIFSVAETISVLSRGMTLEAGDVIATGTPEGVGFARIPPEYLRDGDVVTCEIEGIGRIQNRVVAV